jgi:heme/copper-type cytochrome/quinol oxidase subunit 1
MTVTESAPITEAARGQAPSPPLDVEPAGLAGILGSGDHKVIGRLWIVASLFHLVLAGVAGGALSLERIDTARFGSVISGEWLAQVFTFHSVSGVFLFLLPLTVGLATLIVPLQIGASTLAFPRAAAAAFWAHLVGGALVVGAYAIDGGPFGTDAGGVGLFIAALGLVVAALIVAWLCIATTVATLRAPGVTMTRVPLFTWSNLVAAGVWLLTLPVLGAVLVVMYLDHTYGGEPGTVFLGGGATVYDRAAWVFTQPAVYALAIPVLGFVGSVVPVLSGTRHRLHKVAMGAIGAYGALSLGMWAMPGFDAAGGLERPWLYDGPWIAMSFLVLLPVLVLVGLWLDTARSGRPAPASPLLYGAAAVLMLLAGLFAGAVQAIEPLEVIDGDVPLFNTTMTTAVAHYVVLAATIALLGAVVFWSAKITGRALAEGIQRAVAALLLVGTVMLAFPDVISGILGQASGLGGSITGRNVEAIEALNALSAAGGVLLILTAALWMVALLAGSVSGERPGDDPWQGHTLEWATSSPPPVGNFAGLPEVTSEAPLYDARHREEAST